MGCCLVRMGPIGSLEKPLATFEIEMTSDLATIEAFILAIDKNIARYVGGVKGVSDFEAHGSYSTARVGFGPIDDVLKASVLEKSATKLVIEADNVIVPKSTPTAGAEKAFTSGGAGCRLKVNWVFEATGGGVIRFTRIVKSFEQHPKSLPFILVPWHRMLISQMSAENGKMKACVEQASGTSSITA